MKMKTLLLGAAAAFVLAPAAQAERGTDGELKLLFNQAVSTLNVYLSQGTKDITASSLVLEPMGRNTAPAVTLAALAAIEAGEDPVMVVTPADQAITDEAAFCAALREAARAAAGGDIVILGIRPDRPETGYGYIRVEPSDAKVFSVAAFVEKPDADTAQRYVDDGSYFWNSGMFVMRASRWLAALRHYRPDIAQATEAAWADCAAQVDMVHEHQQANR